MSTKEQRALDVLEHAYHKYYPVAVVGMFSGGHDSVCATHLAMRWAAEKPVKRFVAHINTGVGIEATREYVRTISAQYGWTLKEYHPPVSYDEIVRDYGFPGPAAHVHMYRRLKERPIRQLVRESKATHASRVMLVTGVRTQESVRRMAHVETIQREGAKLWVAPIHDWTADDKYDYIDEQGIPRNEVADILHMSGECLCGAFAKPGERQFIRAMFPHERVNKQIDDLEAYLHAHGNPQSWGEAPSQEHDLALCTHCQKYGRTL